MAKLAYSDFFYPPMRERPDVPMSYEFTARVAPSLTSLNDTAKKKKKAPSPAGKLYERNLFKEDEISELGRAVFEHESDFSPKDISSDEYDGIRARRENHIVAEAQRAMGVAEAHHPLAR